MKNKTNTEQIKESISNWNNIKDCPICKKEYFSKCITKYKKGCAMCGYTIKYSPKMLIGYELKNEFKK